MVYRENNNKFTSYNKENFKLKLLEIKKFKVFYKYEFSLE